MQHFEFILKNEKLQSYKKITLLLEFTYLIVALYYTFVIRQSGSIVFPLILFLLVGGNFLLNYFSKTSTGNYSLMQKIGDAVVIIAFFIMFKNFWIAFVILLLSISRYMASKKIRVVFEDDQIRLFFLTKKIVQWQQLNNAILKDGILTIDFKDDRLIQAQIEEENDPADETVFNQFCVHQLQTVHPQP